MTPPTDPPPFACPEPALPLPLDDQLCFSLYATSIAINRVYKPMLDRLGITYPQYLVLHTLWEQDARTIGAIATRLALEPSTVTPLAKRLEQAGIVARVRDAHDERQVRVGLTDRGRALQTESACLGEAILARTGMTLAQLAELTRQIQALRGALATADEPTGT